MARIAVAARIKRWSANTTYDAALRTLFSATSPIPLSSLSSSSWSGSVSVGMMMTARSTSTIMRVASITSEIQQQLLMIRHQQSRSFAWNKKWKQKAPRKKPNKEYNNQQNRSKNAPGRGGRQRKGIPHKKHHEDLLSAEAENIQQHGEAGKFVPPAVLLPTGSPHVYVASIAAEAAGITDPRQQLFPASPDVEGDGDCKKKHTPTRQMPRIFRQASFEYFSPGALKYELPGSKNQVQGYSSSNNRSSIPEVAFLGRSNVGKSSLINALMGRDLARISKQPGRTQLVHYFGLVPHSVLVEQQKRKSSASWSSSSSSDGGGETHLDPNQCLGFFVDLPGYGYAVAPDEKVDDWQKKTQMFLTDRIAMGNLRRLFLLLDVRHGATTFDQSIMVWLEEASIPYTIVYTKADCVDRPTIVKHVNQTCLRYHHLHVQWEEDAYGNDDKDELYMSPVIHVTSSKAGSKGSGLRELLENIEAEFLLAPS